MDDDLPDVDVKKEKDLTVSRDMSSWSRHVLHDAGHDLEAHLFPLGRAAVRLGVCISLYCL